MKRLSLKEVQDSIKLYNELINESNSRLEIECAYGGYQLVKEIGKSTIHVTYGYKPLRHIDTFLKGMLYVLQLIKYTNENRDKS